jgi:hypothetical protein
MLCIIKKQETFETLLHGNQSDPDWEFKPLLVCFYAHWSHDVFGYLYAYNMTVQQYKQDGANLIYGLVDLTKDSTKKCKQEVIELN